MKAKITFVVEVEIELEPELYGRDIEPSKLTPERMLDMELQIADCDPVEYVNCDDAKWTITGELIE